MPSDSALPPDLLARTPVTTFPLQGLEVEAPSWLERLLGSLGGKAALSVLDQGLVSGASFITSVLIGRRCGQDALGAYYLAWSLVVLLRGVQETIVSAPYTVFSPEREGTALRTYAGSTLVHHGALIGLGVMLVSAYLLHQAWAGGVARAVPVAQVLLVAIPLLLLREYIRGLCLAHLELPVVLGIDSVVALVQIGALSVLAFAGALTVSRAFGVMAVACAAASAGWALLRGRSRFLFDSSRWRADWRQNWSFGRWALATYLIGCSTPSIVPWLLTLWQGTSATGLFAACMTVLGFANVVVQGLTNLAVPRAARGLAQGGIPRLRRTMRATALMLALPCLLFVGVAAVAGDAIVVLIYGTRYAHAGPVLLVLALWLLFNSVGIGAGSGLWAMNRPKAGLIADLLVIVTTLVAAWATIGTMGCLGAAAGMALGAFVGMGARWLAVIVVCSRSSGARHARDADV